MIIILSSNGMYAPGAGSDLDANASSLHGAMQSVWGFFRRNHLAAATEPTSHAVDAGFANVMPAPGAAEMLAVSHNDHNDIARNPAHDLFVHQVLMRVAVLKNSLSTLEALLYQCIDLLNKKQNATTTIEYQTANQQLIVLMKNDSILQIMLSSTAIVSADLQALMPHIKPHTATKSFNTRKIWMYIAFGIYFMLIHTVTFITIGYQIWFKKPLP